MTHHKWRAFRKYLLPLIGGLLIFILFIVLVKEVQRAYRGEQDVKPAVTAAQAKAADSDANEELSASLSDITADSEKEADPVSDSAETVQEEPDQSAEQQDGSDTGKQDDDDEKGILDSIIDWFKGLGDEEGN